MDIKDEQKIRQLFDDYLRMYSSRDDQLTDFFSTDFSGFTGGGDFLVKDRDAWVDITRQDFAQVKDSLRIELLDLSVQSLAETIAVATGFFHIHLPIEDQVLSRETARLVLIFRQESSGWKICHSSISIPYNLVGEGEVYPLKKLEESNRILEELVATRTQQLSKVNATLQQVNEQLAKEITDRQKSDEALQKSEEHFRLIAENVSDVVWKLDRDYHFTYISPSDERLRGYSADEVIGRHVFDFFDEDGIATAKEFTYQRRQNELQGIQTGNVMFEARHRRKDGSYFWAEVNSTPELDPDGNVIGYYGITRDITERKLAEKNRVDFEKQLRQKHKMEAVGYMAGGMAHNFNNNLSIILGNLELSQMKQPPGSEVNRYLEDAKTAVRRSRDLILKIISYSRQGIQKKQPTRLTDIIDETVSLLQSTLPATVNLQRLYEPDCETRRVNADVSQIQEVLINLCNNAVHAMDEQGDLTISLEPVELDQGNIPAQYDCLPGHYAKLCVQDSGCGIASELLDHIFDPFFSTKEEYAGAGMGLATVEGIVAQHGGMIKVSSVPGEGATFELYFPIVGVQHTKEEPLIKQSALAGGTEQILYVDDDLMLAELQAQLLTEQGYTVSVMDDSQEALKLFAANAEGFDLVITDQTMPNLTGEELICKIKKIHPDIPTILCTGYSTRIDEDKATDLGISAFMMKPVDLPQLLQTIRNVLEQN